MCAATASDALETDTIMYAASLTKAAFAYTVMQLTEEKKLDLDRSIGGYLAKPLPEYPDDDDFLPPPQRRPTSCIIDVALAPARSPSIRGTR